MFSKEAVEQYVPSNNRSQIIQKDTNKIILDAYNANPTSMEAALLNFKNQDGKKIAIIGDMFELGEDAKKEHQKIIEFALELDFDKVIFVGANFYNTKLNSDKAITYNSFESFVNNEDLSVINDTTLLIKGSRGMALERVLEFI